MEEGNGVRTSEPLSSYAQSTLALLSMFFTLCTVVKYTPDQIRKMEDSNRIFKASEPVELIKLVKEIKKEFFLSEQSPVELPQHLKQKMTDEIVGRLRGLRAGANVSEQREAVESWRKEKLKKAKLLTPGKTLSSTVPPKEVGTLARALESGWSQLSNEIGLWIPVEINNEEHDDKLEGATDFESAYDCCQAWLDHSKRARPGEKKCNIWVYCPSETGCYSPDIYEHKHMECWLKYAEKPRVNFKDKYSESYRNSHPNVPVIVPWFSGVVTA
ncbi:hypothetical protein LOK49_LG08G00813 [Camellia lanceoleosa]|uniref:Uncharacterized protein n=1 Tax=Camellia lanceoleosa TaxID=1840588 RepID=A0ACC0GU79_9ERIC|nr:hypothetical protein LOK49_LG08G00813 [Camellia lanceoleosa]